jgi:hypothetical protein
MTQDKKVEFDEKKSCGTAEKKMQIDTEARETSA